MILYKPKSDTLQLKIKAIKAKGDRFYNKLLDDGYKEANEGTKTPKKEETPKKQISNYYDKLPTKEPVYQSFKFCCPTDASLII